MFWRFQIFGINDNKKDKQWGPEHSSQSKSFPQVVLALMTSVWVMDPMAGFWSGIKKVSGPLHTAHVFSHTMKWRIADKLIVFCTIRNLPGYLHWRRTESKTSKGIRSADTAVLLRTGLFSNCHFFMWWHSGVWSTPNDKLPRVGANVTVPICRRTIGTTLTWPFRGVTIVVSFGLPWLFSGINRMAAFIGGYLGEG